MKKIIVFIGMVLICLAFVCCAENPNPGNPTEICENEAESDIGTEIYSETERITETQAEIASESETEVVEIITETEKYTETDAESETDTKTGSDTGSEKTGENISAPEPVKAKIAEPTYINGILIANKSYPLPSSYNPGNDPEAYSAVQDMIKGAANDGISLKVISGFRSYQTQQSVYANYVARDGRDIADTYSARPGHSEHQTGLAFDINSLYYSFADTKEGKWLAEHCVEYGFIIRYPKGKESVTGYNYEPWHVRYLGTDTAKAVFESGLCLEEYLGITSVYGY